MPVIRLFAASSPPRHGGFLSACSANGLVAACLPRRELNPSPPRRTAASSGTVRADKRQQNCCAPFVLWAGWRSRPGWQPPHGGPSCISRRTALSLAVADTRLRCVTCGFTLAAAKPTATVTDGLLTRYRQSTSILRILLARITAPRSCQHGACPCGRVLVFSARSCQPLALAVCLTPTRKACWHGGSGLASIPARAGFEPTR